MRKKYAVEAFVPAVLLLFFLLPAPAHGATLNVRCGIPTARYKTIAAGLADLPAREPNTLMVSGVCNEDVSITTMDHLTLQGNPTAVLNGTGTSSPAVLVEVSQDVTISNFTINGGQGVQCGGSVCVLNNDIIQGSAIHGVLVNGGSALLIDCTLQNNAAGGLRSNGLINVSGGIIQNNGGEGILVDDNGRLILELDDSNVAPIIRNNPGDGIMAFDHATVVSQGATVSGNSGDGLALGGSSTADLSAAGITINSNLGHGVRIGDLSFVQFGTGDTIVSNHAPDVVCDPLFSTTRGINSVTVNGTTTNCPAELPINP